MGFFKLAFVLSIHHFLATKVDVILVKEIKSLASGILIILKQLSVVANTIQ